LALSFHIHCSGVVAALRVERCMCGSLARGGRTDRKPLAARSNAIWPPPHTCALSFRSTLVFVVRIYPWIAAQVTMQRDCVYQATLRTASRPPLFADIIAWDNGRFQVQAIECLPRIHYISLMELPIIPEDSFNNASRARSQV
jgi:hypothetical protein